jgi:hypothetical protein
MPKAVAVRFRDYVAIETYLKKQGFREMSRREVADDIIAHGVKFFHKSTGTEKGFVLTYKGLTIKGWTSCDRERVDDCYRELATHPLLKEAIGDVIVGRAPGTDMGWIVVVDSKDKAQYFAAPFHRTKNFGLSLCEAARVTQIRIQNRPLCAECQVYMMIRQEESRATYWACFRTASHAGQKPVFLNWDHALPPAAKKVVTRRRNKRKSWQKTKAKLRAEGKPVRSAREIRRGGIATKNPYAA